MEVGPAPFLEKGSGEFPLSAGKSGVDVGERLVVVEEGMMSAVCRCMLVGVFVMLLRGVRRIRHLAGFDGTIRGNFGHHHWFPEGWHGRRGT